MFANARMGTCLHSIRSLACAVFLTALGLGTSLWAQTADDGFHRVSGKHVEIVTDLPLDDSLRELPEVFDAAMPHWCRTFRVAPAEVESWRTTAYIMLARDRFSKAGFLPEKLPPFPHGFQMGNDLWVVEQASHYYRRHLLLHEGTHWFMARKFGTAGPPWMMEGMAELLATHHWRAGQLEMGIIPRSRDEVPLWGRISLIQQQLSDGLAPSLETILRYDNRAHQNTDAYAWSWAAVVFMNNHPSTQNAFQKLFDGRATNIRIRNDDTPTRQLLRSLQNRMPLVRAEWSAMLTGLDYGFVPDRELVDLDHRSQPLDRPATLKIDASKGWQTTSIQVAQGQTFEVNATGRFVVGTEGKPWLCEADGVTIRYHQGQPLGKLLLAIAGSIDKKPEFSELLTITPIGKQAKVTAASSGQILLRVNETGRDLDDNSGSLSVTISP